MIPRPRLLLLDEPSLGLSPNLVASVFGRIAEVGRQTGVAMLVVEQKVREVLAISQRVYSLKLGRVAFVGASASLKNDRGRLRDLFL
jgi:ABC-type branched-subunit amino acid transport system ATPase component